MAKADNLLAILWLLRLRKRMTAPQIAAELETSVRTVYRYIDALCASGVPIEAETGPDGGYRLPDSFRSAPLFFEPMELVALFHAALFARGSGHPYTEALEAALKKVRLNLSPEQIDQLERHVTGVVVSQQQSARAGEGWLGALEQAVAERRTVQIAYQRPEDEVAEPRLVDPYGLAFQYSRWYMVGWCHKRQELRQFRVDRIDGLLETDQRFERPAGFRLEEHFGQEGEWIAQRLQSEPVVELHLQGEPAVLARLCDHWYLQHGVLSRSPREVRFRVEEGARSFVAGVLLSYGTGVRVVAPEAWRRMIAQTALQWAEHHGA